MPKRDPEATRRKILDAATELFAALGLEGVRIDAVAAAAGVNKRMIYHYFGDKEALLDAVIEVRLEVSPWTGRAAPDPTDARLMGWEGLQSDAGPPGPARRAGIGALVDELEARRERGMLDASLSVRQLALVIVAARLAPTLCPQYVDLVGLEPDGVVQGQEAFLEALLTALKPAPSAPPSKPRVKLKPRLRG